MFEHSLVNVTELLLPAPRDAQPQRSSALSLTGRAQKPRDSVGGGSPRVLTFLLSPCMGMAKGTPEVSDPSDTRKILINKIVPIKSV